MADTRKLEVTIISYISKIYINPTVKKKGGFSLIHDIKTLSYPSFCAYTVNSP